MADLSGAQRAALAAERAAQQKVEGEIGAFVFAFSQLELTIQYVLGSALRLEGEILSAVTGPYDFAMLCKVTNAVLGAKPDWTSLFTTVSISCSGTAWA